MTILGGQKLSILTSYNGHFVSKGVIIYVEHECESKGVTSLLITPVPQSSVPGFAASKVGSPWLGVFFVVFFVVIIIYLFIIIFF